MSRRASLPGAEELFRRTSGQGRAAKAEPRKAEPRKAEPKSTNLQVASGSDAPSAGARKAPKHDEKVTFYCTAQDLMDLERTRLALRAEHGVGVDRGKIVRAALAYVLEDFEARADDSILLRRLRDES